MNSLVRMIYFAHEAKIKMDDIEVIDIKKMRKIYGIKTEGKYVLVTSGHRYLRDIKSEGSIQKIIEREEYESKIRVRK